MPTPAEHRALLFVAAVAALGVGVRGVRALQEPFLPATDRAALARQIANVDSVIALGGQRRTPSSKATAAPASGGGGPALPTPRAEAALTVDLDIAGVDQLDRLPGIGPTLAARIVADRAARGPFGSLAGLQRVNGIGPALAARLQPYVTFSLPSRPNDAEHSARQGTRRP